LEDPAVGAWIDRARAGDDAALARLFQHYESDIAGVCRRLLGPGPGVDDAGSEVFLRLRRGLESYRPERPFRPWLLAVASHHCIDVLRRRRAEQRLFEPADLEAGDLADPGPSPLRRLTGAEERARVATAIEALPEKYRLPLVLRYFQDLDYAAIGDLLGVSREQVGTLLYRARRRLRAELGGAER
jgi:RNA polymerase sigma-70 factor (ECF subfamily)